MLNEYKESSRQSSRVLQLLRIAVKQSANQRVLVVNWLKNASVTWVRSSVPVNQPWTTGHLVYSSLKFISEASHLNLSFLCFGLIFTWSTASFYFLLELYDKGGSALKVAY